MDHRSSTLRRVGVGVGGGAHSRLRARDTGRGAPQNKITICHATSSVSNPHVQNAVNENSIVKPNGQPSGHGKHTGPIYPQQGWGDIIPSFSYTNDHGGTSIYPGLNWSTDGQAIWNGGCLVDPTPPEPPETTTTNPEVTTTTSGSTTTHPGSTTTHPGGSTTTTSGSTTTSSGPSSSTTSHPGESTTTTLPPTTTPTTAPPSELPPPVTDPGEGVETMPPTEAVVVDPNGVVVDLGMLSVSERMSLEAQVDASTPPTTTTTRPPAPLAGTG